MRCGLWILVIAACGKSASKDNEGSASPPPVVAAAPAIDGATARPPDDMDEKMRHCPLTVDGATATYALEPTGTRWEITASAAGGTAEIQRRAKHIVEFAAGRSEKGVHGGGQGGGRMRNCPVLTSGVVITETDIPGGARLVVAPVTPGDAAQMREDTVARAKAFSFPNVTVVAATVP
jgi:hypothetical protein